MTYSGYPSIYSVFQCSGRFFADDVRRHATAPRLRGEMSAIDAAAKVLTDASTPMNCQELITAMAGRSAETDRRQDAAWHTPIRDAA
jgi:hypothetical protein